MSGTKFLTGFLVGGAIGAIAGILLAPKSGEETRAKIAETAKDVSRRAEETVKENNIDIIISTSLGSFISMSANVPGTFKAIINPCLDPVNEIPKLDPNTGIDRLSYFAKELEFENNMNCIGFFAIEDELFGDKFENKFFSITHGANIVHIDGGHSISKEGASEVASILKTIFNSYE